MIMSTDDAPLNTRDATAIGKWLLDGMMEWDKLENPWVNAFPPLVLYNDLDLERQLFNHFVNAGDESIKRFQNGLKLALEQWKNQIPYNYEALQGLLYLVSGTGTTVPFVDILWELMTQHLQTNTPEADFTLLIAVNTLVSLSPDPVAVNLLKKFHTEGKADKLWRSNFAALTLQTYIENDPQNWTKYLAELRDDLKTIEQKLNPRIFFVRVVNILGLQCIADQLHKLDLDEITQQILSNGLVKNDKWFIDKLLGLDKSPAIALRNKKGQWYLTDRDEFATTGKKYFIELTESKTSERLLQLFKVYNNEEKCLPLVKQLLAAYVAKDINKTTIKNKINVLIHTFGEPVVLHFIAAEICLKQFDKDTRKQISELLLTETSNRQKTPKLTEQEQCILKIIDDFSAINIETRRSKIQQLITTYLKDFKDSPKTINSLIKDGVLVSVGGILTLSILWFEIQRIL